MLTLDQRDRVVDGVDAVEWRKAPGTEAAVAPKHRQLRPPIGRQRHRRGLGAFQNLRRQSFVGNDGNIDVAVAGAESAMGQAADQVDAEQLGTERLLPERHHPAREIGRDRCSVGGARHRLKTQRLAVDPRHRDTHQQQPDGVINDLLDRDRERDRRHHVIDQVGRDHGEAGDGDAKAQALRQPRLVLLALVVDPGEGRAEQRLRQDHPVHQSVGLLRLSHAGGRRIVGRRAARHGRRSSAPRP